MRRTTAIRASLGALIFLLTLATAAWAIKASLFMKTDTVVAPARDTSLADGVAASPEEMRRLAEAKAIEQLQQELLDRAGDQKVGGVSTTTAPSQVEQPAGPPPQGAGATWEPPRGLEFLKTVSELRGVRLGMGEQEFQQLVKSRGLNVRPDRRADRSSYWVSTDSGENVIVMFREGVCSGAQSMQPSPPTTRPVPSRRHGGPIKK